MAYATTAAVARIVVVEPDSSDELASRSEIAVVASRIAVMTGLNAVSRSSG